MTSTADAAANTPEEFFGTGFGYADKVLTIPSKTLTQTTPQFDFMFSDVYERDLNTNPDYVTPVELNFRHLFTAFGITAQNKTENKIIIKKISISGFTNTMSGSIIFNTDSEMGSAVWSITSSSSTASSQFVFEPNKQLSNVAVGMTSANETSDYFLMWPHTTEAQVENIKLNIEYTFNGENMPNKEVNLASTYRLNAGVKNTINILFDIDQITFVIVNLVPWNEVENDIPVEL